MNRLALIFLAATALAPAAALAQPYVDEAEARYRDYQRMERGAVVPNRWWAPGYTIVEWSGYGLSEPSHGHRWIRYYDDALLIDHQGRIIDSRYDMDWDAYASAWSYDSDGVPILIGGGHAYAQAEHHGRGYKTKRFYSHHPGYGGGYAYPAYGHAGWGYAGYSGGWVTETTVTYEDCCCEEEEVYEAPVYTPPPPPPPPPPMPGERG